MNYKQILVILLILFCGYIKCAQPKQDDTSLSKVCKYTEITDSGLSKEIAEEQHNLGESLVPIIKYGMSFVNQSEKEANPHYKSLQYEVYSKYKYLNLLWNLQTDRETLNGTVKSEPKKITHLSPTMKKLVTLTGSTASQTSAAEADMLYTMNETYPYFSLVDFTLEPNLQEIEKLYQVANRESNKSGTANPPLLPKSVYEGRKVLFCKFYNALLNLDKSRESIAKKTATTESTAISTKEKKAPDKK